MAKIEFPSRTLQQIAAVGISTKQVQWMVTHAISLAAVTRVLFEKRVTIYV